MGNMDGGVMVNVMMLEMSVLIMTTLIFANESSLVSIGQSPVGAGEEASFWSENWH